MVAVTTCPAGAHPDAAALDVLAGVLGDTPSGRLYKALVDNKKAVGAAMVVAELHDPGFMIGVVSLQRTSPSTKPARRCSRPSKGSSPNRPARKKWSASRPGC